MGHIHQSIYKQPVYDYTTLPWQSELQTKHEGRQLLETNEGKRTQFPERSPKKQSTIDRTKSPKLRSIKIDRRR